jgi:hypothetical protein
MADQDERRYSVGFGKPPRETRFRPGRSGNPRGRPKGAKNFATALEEELRARVPVTENGRRRKLSKRQVIAKRLVNRAAEGDLKAVPLLLNEMRPHESARELGAVEEIFGGPEQQPLIDSIVQRIRAASTTASDQQPEAPPAGREAAGQGPEEAG